MTPASAAQRAGTKLEQTESPLGARREPLILRLSLSGAVALFRSLLLRITAVLSIR